MKDGTFSRYVTMPLVALTALALVAASPATRPAAWISPAQFDFKAILPGPPADDSPEHKQEIDRMLDLQFRRTPDEVKRCQSEEDVTVFAFSTVLGGGFNAQDLPATARLMHEVYAEAREVSNAAKLQWRRVRPPLAEPRIRPCVMLEHTASYPSGHAVRGVVWATLLADVFPQRKAELMARGIQIGDDRFLAGMHYPSDVTAGQILGAEIAKRLLADESFKAEFENVKQECRGHAIGK